MAKLDYDIGKGKPPKAHQWPKGVSGNPAGRKKGSRGLKTDLKAELNSRITITENGKTITLTKQQVILKALATKAAKGDVKAANSIVALTIQMHGIEDVREGKSQISDADNAILKDYLASIAGSSEPPPDWPSDQLGIANAEDGNGQSEVGSDDHPIPNSNEDDGEELDDDN